MSKVKAIVLLLLSGCLSASPVAAQQARQMARATTGFGDSSLVITSDTLTSKTTFVTKAVSLAQLRKSLSKFAFDSVVTLKATFAGATISGAYANAGLVTFNGGATVASGQTLTLTGATIAGSPTWSSTQTMNISGSVVGNATTATTLATPRAINGVNFDGSAPITITAAASTVTGTTLAANVVTSSLTTIGTLVGGAVPASLVTAGTFASGAFAFQGGVSGITTLAGSGAVSGFTTAAFSNAVTVTKHVTTVRTTPLFNLNGTTSGDAMSMIFSDGINSNGWFGYKDSGTASARYFYLSADDGVSDQFKFAQTGLATFPSLTVSTGTTAVQALTATDGIFATSGSDLRVYRSGATTTGYVKFGSSGTNYIGFNGTSFDVNGGAFNTQALTASGTITSTLGNNTVVLSATTATTGYTAAVFQNTSGQAVFAVNGSTATALMTGGNAYAVSVYNALNNPLDFGTNGIRRGGFSAAGAFDVVGGLSAASITATTSDMAFSTNNKFLYGVNTSVVSKKMIGINSSNLVSIDADALGAVFGAGISASTGTFSSFVTPAFIRFTSAACGGCTTGDIYFNTSTFGIGGGLLPLSDNTWALGASGQTWKNLWLTSAASGVGDVFLCQKTTHETTAGATCAASTQKIKNAITTLPSGLSLVNALRPVTFQYQPGFYNQRKDIGFIAEEVAKVDPRFAFYAAADEKLSNGAKITKGDPESLNTSAILSALVRAVQEQELEIAQLRTQLAKRPPLTN